MTKYLKRFAQHADYEAYMGGGEVYLPNVSACDDETNVVHYNPIVEPTIPSNEIWYTTTTNETIDPSEHYEGVAMVSNTYDGKKCIMRFEEDITDITELFDNYGREEDETQLLIVRLPSSMISIGGAAFLSCVNLISITIPNSVTSIGEAAFIKCPNMTSIIVESGNTQYDSRDNCNAIIETSTNTLIAGCKTTVIPNSVTSIGGDAFNYCTTLTSINIPNSVKSIGVYAFHHCTELASITIGSSITTIEEYAFFECSSLTSITIPNSVTSIGEWAFQNCSGLTTMTIEATTPPTLGDYAISDATTAIYVPSESVDAYKAATNWSEFADIIQPIS